MDDSSGISFKGGLRILQQGNDRRSWYLYGILGGLALEAVVLIIGGVWFGRYLAQISGCPLLLFAGLVLGLACGGFSIYYVIKQQLKKD